MPTKRRQKLLREFDAIQRALESLGGEQSIEAICGWIKTNAPDLYDQHRIQSLLRGHPNSRYKELGPKPLERTEQGYFRLGNSLTRRGEKQSTVSGI
jgi:hypothetical protein